VLTRLAVQENLVGFFTTEVKSLGAKLATAAGKAWVGVN
jgi:hypothetical protein